MATFNSGDIATAVEAVSAATAGQRYTVTVSNAVSAVSAASTGRLTDSIRITVTTSPSISVTANTSVGITV